MQSPINDFYDKILIINMDRSTQRWSDSQEEFAQRNIVMERFPAFDAQQHMREFGSVTMPNGRELSFGDPQISGMLGCKISHYNAIKYAHEQGVQKLLIFEDDVVLRPDINQRFSKYVKCLPEPWHMLYFICHNTSAPKNSPLVAPNIRQLRRGYSVSGYSINMIFAPNLLEMLERSKKDCSVDRHFSKIHGHNDHCYVFEPYLVAPRKIKSDIGHVFRSHKDWKPIFEQESWLNSA